MTITTLEIIRVDNNYKTVSVYALLDPYTFQPCYCGITNSALPRRLGQHVAASKLALDTRLSAWLRGLVGLGLQPFPALLERVTRADAREAEVRWIARLKKEGHDLVNGDGGGTGPLGGGYTWTEESRLRLGAAKAGVKKIGTTSQYVGVCRATSGRWMAQLAGRYLGTYDSEEEAFMAYRMAYKERYGRDLLGYESDDDQGLSKVA